MNKTYIEFLYGGMFSDIGGTQEISHRDPSKVEMLKGVCGFRFYDRQVTMSNGEELKGNIKNSTGWYYKGTKCSLNDVRNMNVIENGRYDILISNMECNHWDYVVKLDGGYVYPLGENDTVL